MHTPASGPGWGGSAKGAGRGGPAHAGNPGNKSTSDKVAIARKQRTNEERAARMLDILEDIAEGGQFETNRMNAADKLLDRLVGKPTQALDMTTGGRPIGYANVPPVAKTMEEWERIAKTPPPEDS